MAQHKTILPLTQIIGYVTSKDKSMFCAVSEIERHSNSNPKEFFFMLFSTQNNEIVRNFKDKIDSGLDLEKIMDFSPDNKYFVYSRESDFIVLNIEEKKLFNVAVWDYEEVNIFVDEDSKEIHHLNRDAEANWIDGEGNLIEEYFTCYKLVKTNVPPFLLKFIDNENLLILTWSSIKIFNIKTNVTTQVLHDFSLETAYIKNNRTLILIRKERSNNNNILEFCSLSVDQLVKYQKKFEKHIIRHYQSGLNFGENFNKFDHEMKWLRFPELKEFTSIDSCGDYFILALKYPDNTLHYLDFREYYSDGSYAYFERILKIPIMMNNEPVMNVILKLKNALDPRYNAIILGTFYKDFMFICQWNHKIWGISNNTEIFYMDISQTAFYKLAELITCDLTDGTSQIEQHWKAFLRKGLYDPRLFYLIYEFVREPENANFPIENAHIPVGNLFQLGQFFGNFALPADNAPNPDIDAVVEEAEDVEDVEIDEEEEH